MANWSNNTITITGIGLNELATRLNNALEPSGDELALTFTSWGVDKEWMLLREPLKVKVKDGEIGFGSESKWYPPIRGLEKLSEEFPSIVIFVRYDVESLWDAGEWRIERGESTLLTHRRGYFRSAEQEQPVHHWLCFCGSEEVVKAIQEAGLAVAGEEDKSRQQLTVRDKDAVQKLVQARFPDVEVSANPYTLDEEGYIASLQTLADGGRSDRAEAPHLQELIRVVERTIVLTPDEVAVVRDHWREWKLIPAEDDRNEPLVNEIEKDRVRRYYGSVALGEAVEFHPTTREIQWLLPLCKDGSRKKKLEQALAEPRWTTQWPAWEYREEERKRAEAGRLEDNKRVIIPKDWLERLVADPAEFNKRLLEEEKKAFSASLLGAS